MKTISSVVLVVFLGMLGVASAQVPQIVNYQGRVSVNGTNFTGTGQFKFALVNATGATTYWSNGVATVSVPTTNGLYAVLLGDTGMNPIPATVFTNGNVNLRVWFDDGLAGLQQLSPDQRLAAVGYALMAASHHPSADVTGLRLNIGISNTLTGTLATIAGGMLNVAGGVHSAVGGGRNNSASAHYSVVGGGYFNVASGWGAFIGGGGYDGVLAFGNTASGAGSVIGGGIANTAGGLESTVGGGRDNHATNEYSTVAGGAFNTASGDTSTVGGGVQNTSSGNYDTVGGGANNTSSGGFATVGGGNQNINSGNFATVGGGANNTNGGAWATVGGGISNAITSGGRSATVAGGENNSAGAPAAAVGGGQLNTATGFLVPTVAGGIGNTSSEYGATVGGGGYNLSSGQFATVPGGLGNHALGYNSFAAGDGARALHDGCFVWSDVDELAPFAQSTADNQFVIRASGGIQMWTNTSLFCGIQTRQMLNLWGTQYGIGVQNYALYFRTDAADNAGGFAWFKGGSHTNAQFNPGPGGTQLMRLENNGDLYTWGTVNPPSDRNAKQDFRPVDARRVLAQVAALPLTTWRYKHDGNATRHIGPVAQDFHAAFAVGTDDKHIATVDADGVALAAIKGLYEVVMERDARIAELEKRLAEIERKRQEGGE